MTHDSPEEGGVDFREFETISPRLDDEFAPDLLKESNVQSKLMFEKHFLKAVKSATNQRDQK